MSAFTKPPVVGTGNISDSSVTTGKILDGTIANADVATAAAIALSKLAALTASRVVETDSSGVLTSSSAQAAHLQVLQLDGIDGKTTGVTTIATTVAGKRFYPLFVGAEVTTADTIAVAPTVSIGTNDASYNNLLTATALTGLTVVNALIGLVPITAAKLSVAPSTAIKANVTVGATATTCTIRVFAVGFYL